MNIHQDCLPILKSLNLLLGLRLDSLLFTPLAIKTAHPTCPNVLAIVNLNKEVKQGKLKLSEIEFI